MLTANSRFKKSHEGTSYFRFVYVDLSENMPASFTCDDALLFFRDPAQRRHLGQMKTDSPYEHMYRGCEVNSSGHADAVSFEVMERINKHWDKEGKSLIPEIISSFVIQFNLTGACVKELYLKKRFSDLSAHIIGVREDKISRQEPVWKTGIWQPVVRLDNEKRHGGCVMM